MNGGWGPTPQFVAMVPKLPTEPKIVPQPLSVAFVEITSPWIHNGRDERINARHAKNTRSNLLCFDNSAATYDAFQLPSVNDKTTGEVRRRF